MTNTDNMNYRHDYEPPQFLAKTVDLTVDLRQDETVVTNCMQVYANPDYPDPTLVLNGREQQLHEVQLNGHVLDSTQYTLTDKTLTIDDLDQASTHYVTVKSSHRPDHNTSLIGLYRSQGNYCTQCESDGFSKITYALDRPDVLSVFTTKIIGDEQALPVMLSNGNCQEKGTYDDNGNHYVIWHDPFPKPCYLFALVAGQLGCLQDEFVTQSGRSIDLRIYAEPNAVEQCHYAMQALKKAMRWDEDCYDREYDLDIFMIVAVNDFNFGAMENKGLNIFNDRFILVDPQTATDRDYAAVDVVVGHEYFHNWSGNRITLKNWFQICLKEGLTVFREQSFTETINDEAVDRIQQIKRLRQAQFPEDAGPLAHPVRPDAYLEMNNFYTPTVYEKGAEIIRMLRNLVGDETFRQGVQHYFDQFDGQAVTCDDWLDAMQEGTGYDLSQFRKWYSQIGTPRLEISDTYDADSQQYQVTIQQKLGTTPNAQPNEPMQMPIALGLLDQQGRSCLDPDTQVVTVNDWQQTFTFDNIPQRPIPSLLRSLSAPVQWSYDYDDDTLAFLVNHDQEGVARWEASQRLVQNSLKSLVEQHQNGQAYQKPTVVLNMLEKLLKHTDDHPALLAEILDFPPNSALFQYFEHLPVDAVLQARAYFQQVIVEHKPALWFEAYERHHHQATYHYTPEQVAQRQLKNQILMQLAYSGVSPDQVSHLAFHQYETAHNMTDQYAALACLNHIKDKRCEIANQRFYDQWQHEPLVMDKWLAAQAASTAPDTLDTIKHLMQSEVYCQTNPNKVRALLGTLGRNFSAFHSQPDQTYPFYTQQILELDAINPLVAAKLATNLSNWASLAEPHGDIMRQQLEYISQKDNISNDLYEIVDKSLKTKE